MRQPDNYDPLKQYLDVGVYRNILTIINTLQTINDRALSHMRYAFMVFGSPVTHPYGIGKAAQGYAIKRVGNRGDRTWEKYVHANITNTLPANIKGILKYPFSRINLVDAVRQVENGIHRARDDIQELLRVARTLQLELNRVRLPVPDNFLQYLNRLNDLSYDLDQVRSVSSAQSGKLSKNNTVTLPPPSEQYGINIWELYDELKEAKKSFDDIRVSIRFEIDAANYAKFVQEETIRRENEALKERARIEAEAIERKKKIEAEKAAALRAELERIAREKERLAQEQIERERLAEKIAQEKASEAEKEKVIQLEKIIEEKERVIDQQIAKINDVIKHSPPVPVKEPQPAQSEQAVQSVNTVQPAQPARTIQPVQPVRTIQPVQPVRSNQPVPVRVYQDDNVDTQVLPTKNQGAAKLIIPAAILLLTTLG